MPLREILISKESRCSFIACCPNPIPWRHAPINTLPRTTASVYGSHRLYTMLCTSLRVLAAEGGFSSAAFTRDDDGVYAERERLIR